MRINGINNVNAIYKTNKAKKAYGSTDVKKSSDTVAISDFAKELSIANNAVKHTSDIRTDKVGTIKSQMEAGTYNVSASEVADKLINKFYV